MRNRRTYGDAGWIFGLVIIILCIIGWVMNIITIFGMENIISVEGAVRIIGVFVAPLGSIIGYF